MIGNFTEVKPLRYWVQHILPLVYDDSLSYMELLGKVVNTLNEVVKNNNLLPDYIMELIKEYISSREIEKVLAEVLANYMLNVKFPPAGLKPATGDGSADDTEAIQGCIDYAYNNGGMSVYFPSGSYLTQPLTLRDKATLFGQDRYTTRLVMKGGATTPMFTGDLDELTLTSLGFDGNMDIQVNNVNLFTISVNSAIITNCLLTDGYDLLNITVNDDLQLNDVIFRHAVENALVLKGAGIVQGNNLIFKSVSTLVGKNFVVMDVSKSILEQLKCYGASPNAVLINGSNNVVKMWNEQSLKAYTDNGANNTVEVYTQSEQKKLTGFKTTNVSGDLTETVGGNKTETITGNKDVSVHDLTETVAGNHTKTVTGDISKSARNFKAVIQLAYELTANRLVEQLTSKEVNATNSTENLGNKTENIANEKHVIAGSVTENITGDKHVNAANSVETVQGDKTVTAGNISETAVNRTVHITKDNTEQTDGTRTLTVSGANNETTGARTETVNGNKSEHITGISNETVDGNKTETVNGLADYQYNAGVVKRVTGGDTENVSGKKSFNVSEFDVTSGTYNRTVNGNVIDNVTGEYTIIFPNSTIDVRKLLSTFKDVTYYGAVGDGVTDDTNAFTSSLTEQGCAIVPDGVFKANIKLNSHTSIIGLGEQSVIIPNTSGTPIISTESGCLGCTIKNLHLRGDKKSNGIFIDKGNGFIIDNVFIEECYNGILVEDKTPGYGRLTHISNTYVYNCMTAGILVSKYPDISLINCECVSCSGNGQNTGYNCLMSDGAFKMINCHFWNQNDDFGLYRTNASLRIVNCSDFEITNCHIEGGYTYNLIIDKSKGCIVNSLIYASFGAYSIRYDSEDCYFIGCKFTGQAGDDVSYKPEFKAIFSNGDVATYTNFIGCSFNAKLVDKTCLFWQILGCVNNDSADLVTLLGQTSYVSCVAFDSNIKYTNIENMYTSQNVRQGNYSWLEKDTTLTGNWYPGCKHYIYNASGNTITITTNYKTEQTFQVETHKFICLIATDSAVQKLS